MLGFMTAGLAIATALPLQAQTPDPDLARIRTALFREVRITDAAGVQRSGVLTSVDDDTLHVASADGPFTASIGSSRRIERRGDSLTNGLLTGGAVGVFSAELTGRAAGFSTAQRLAADAWLGAIYAFVGGAIDAFHTGWTTLKRERTRE